MRHKMAAFIWTRMPLPGADPAVFKAIWSWVEAARMMASLAVFNHLKPNRSQRNLTLPTLQMHLDMIEKISKEQN
jgi:hypothetical protein